MALMSPSGIVSPADVGVIPSIAFLIGVAVGGRATLLGPVLGSIAVSFAETSLASAFPSFWVYLQGLLFVLVVGFLPGGIASLPGVLRRRRRTPATAPGDGDGRGPGGATTPDDPVPTPAAALAAEEAR